MQMSVESRQEPVFSSKTLFAFFGAVLLVVGIFALVGTPEVNTPAELHTSTELMADRGEATTTDLDTAEGCQNDKQWRDDMGNGCGWVGAAHGGRWCQNFGDEKFRQSRRKEVSGNEACCDCKGSRWYKTEGEAMEKADAKEVQAKADEAEKEVKADAKEVQAKADEAEKEVKDTEEKAAKDLAAAADATAKELAAKEVAKEEADGCVWTGCLDRSERACPEGTEWTGQRRYYQTGGCTGGNDQAQCCPSMAKEAAEKADAKLVAEMEAAAQAAQEVADKKENEVKKAKKEAAEDAAELAKEVAEKEVAKVVRRIAAESNAKDQAAEIERKTEAAEEEAAKKLVSEKKEGAAKEMTKKAAARKTKETAAKSEAKESTAKEIANEKAGKDEAERKSKCEANWAAKSGNCLPVVMPIAGADARQMSATNLNDAKRVCAADPTCDGVYTKNYGSGGRRLLSSAEAPATSLWLWDRRRRTAPTAPKPKCNCECGRQGQCGGGCTNCDCEGCAAKNVWVGVIFNKRQSRAGVTCHTGQGGTTYFRPRC